jgi:divalent metal cation (Fe/Co/Zn/Cd) transporter
MKIMRREEWKSYGIGMLGLFLALIGFAALGFVWENGVATLIVSFYILMGAFGIMALGKWIIDTW